MTISAIDTIAIVAEHYKETCGLVRSKEKRREYLLLMIGGLYSLLLLNLFGDEQSLQLTGKILEDYITVEALKENMLVIRGAILFVVALLVHAYFQTDAYIERTYGYIHNIEERLNEISGDLLITREGKSYYATYPYFLWWLWYFYKWVVPLGIVCLTLIVGIKSVIYSGIYSVNSIFTFAVCTLILAISVLYLCLIHAKK